MCSIDKGTNLFLKFFANSFRSSTNMKWFNKKLPVTPFRQGFGLNYKIIIVIIDIIIIIIMIIITIIVLISLSAGQILIPYFLEIGANLRLLS